jgi:hypothetical protein
MTGTASGGSRAGVAGDGVMTGRGTQRRARTVQPIWGQIEPGAMQPRTAAQTGGASEAEGTDSMRSTGISLWTLAVRRA